MRKSSRDRPEHQVRTGNGRCHDGDRKAKVNRMTLRSPMFGTTSQIFNSGFRQPRRADLSLALFRSCSQLPAGFSLVQNQIS
jgi:hypothetical protein